MRAQNGAGKAWKRFCAWDLTLVNNFDAHALHLLEGHLVLLFSGLLKRLLVKVLAVPAAKLLELVVSLAMTLISALLDVLFQLLHGLVGRWRWSYATTSEVLGSIIAGLFAIRTNEKIISVDLACSFGIASKGTNRRVEVAV